MKRTRHFALLLAALLCVCALCMTAYAESDAWDGRTAEPFADGDGTEADPYRIANGAQLYYLTLQSNAESFYVLIDDIDLGNQPFPSIRSFSGVLDGNNHKIVNLNLSSGSSSLTALIGTCTGTVKNLSLYGSVGSTGSYTAAFVAILKGGTIQNCTNYCSVNAKSGHTGGFAGWVGERGQILDCANYGEIQASSNAGGIAGKVVYAAYENVDDTPSITGCLNAANVSGGTAGGICGNQSGTTISECVNTGTITGADAGGIVGYAIADNCEITKYDDDDNKIISYEQWSSFIHDCYNTGEIISLKFGCGGIAGRFMQIRHSGGSNTSYSVFDVSMGVANCYNIGKAIQNNPDGYSGDILGYWSSEWMVYFMPKPTKCLYLTGNNPNAYSKFAEFIRDNGGTDCSEIQLADKSFYAKYDYDFKSVWAMDDSGTYPYAILKRVGLPQPACEHAYELTSDTATCTVAGMKTYTCRKCGDSYTEASPAKGHTPAATGYENEVAATCTTEGSYDEVVRCSVCEAIISSEHKTTEKAAHTPADAVRENEVAATCTTEGSYDEVVYCSVCNGEVSRTPKTSPAKGHTPKEAVRENEVAATCTEVGTYDEVVYCSVCNKELSRTGETTGKAAHTPAAAVRENEVAATCTEDGSYDEVVYCSSCNEELSREKKTIDKLDHDFSGNREFCANGCGTKNPDYIPPHRPPYKPPHVTQPDPTPAKPDKPKNPFKDVSEKDYFYDAVLWAVEKEIASGTQTGMFDAEKACTRAEMVTFLWRAAGKPEPTTRTQPFTDVAESAYYSKAVAWAVEQGIAKGTSSTTFSPDATCTRAQAAAFLYRYAGSPAVSGTIRFNDVQEADYYYDAVRWAVSEKITLGTSAAAFSPDALCTRGQIVTFLYRYLGL